MKRPRVSIVLAVLAVLASSAFAQDVKPKDVLKKITELRMEKLAEARQSSKPVDAAAMSAAVKALAEGATAGVDPEKVPVEDAYDWAQVFSMAEKHHETCRLAERFLASGPAADAKFSAQMLMLQSCNAMGEADKLLETLPMVKPPTAVAGNSLASITVGRYADTIAAKKGVDAALKVLDEVAASLPTEDPAVAGKRNFDNEVARRQQANQAAFTEEEAQKRLEFWTNNARSQALMTKFGFSRKKAELLAAAGRRDDAVKTLDTAIAALPADSPVRNTAMSERNRLTVVGNPAPEFEVERTIGDYKGLSAYKGKVVLLKFFAHW